MAENEECPAQQNYHFFKKELKDLNDTIKYLSNSISDFNKKPKVNYMALHEMKYQMEIFLLAIISSNA